MHKEIPIFVNTDSIYCLNLMSQNVYAVTEVKRITSMAKREKGIFSFTGT